MSSDAGLRRQAGSLVSPDLFFDPGPYECLEMRHLGEADVSGIQGMTEKIDQRRSGRFVIKPRSQPRLSNFREKYCGRSILLIHVLSDMLDAE